VAKVGLNLADLAEEFGPHPLLLGSVNGNIGFVRVIQEGKELVVFFMGNGIIFVGVALGTLDGQAEDTLADRVHPVEHRFHTELFGIDTSFFVDHGIAEEAGRDDLILGCIRHHVAGDLVDNELVVGEVAIEGVDDPVAIEPDLSRLVFLVSIGVGITSGVEPESSPALAVVGGGEEPVDLSLIGVGSVVDRECVNLGDGWWQADQVEAEAAEERRLVGFG